MFADGLLEGSYHVEEKLGEGGFGIVYKARQRTTGQLVAIKTVRLPADKDGAAVDKLLARFLRETKLCAQLYHPNIVQLINSGQTAEGILYTVFSFAPGKSLAKVLAEEGALDPREAQYLMLQVLDALTCAHAQGIVHRDLKPSNIMVIPTGARRNALVLDFGISTVIRNVQSTEYTRLTGTAELVGTPGYATPEQLRGLDSSPATDLFSWGLVFLECLTGKPTFQGHSVPDIIYKQLGPEPIPIPNLLLGHPLGTLLAGVTQKDVEQRPQNASKVLTLLESCDLRDLSRDMLTDGTHPAAGGHHRHAVSFRFANTALLSRIREPADATATGERRQVTALCCELRLRTVDRSKADSPARNTPPRFSERHIEAIEKHYEQLRELFGMCVRVAEQHRGSLVATLGEQLLFFYGFPKADEHDAKRAVRAASAIQDLMWEQSQRLRERDMTLTTHVGIHTGLIVVPRLDNATDADLTVGITPRITTQIAKSAQPTGVLVSEATRLLLRTDFILEAAGMLTEEGEPLRLFRLENIHQVATAVDLEAPSQPLMIGREREVDILFERWTRAIEGTGQCCLVTGEPGIGKSRLVSELAARIQSTPHHLLDFGCTPEAQNSPLLPVIEIVERLIKQEVTHNQNGSQLESLLTRYGLDLVECMPLFSELLSIPIGTQYPPLDYSPNLKKQLTLQAIISLLQRMGTERPVFFLVEDLHWADPTTLEFLTKLAENTSSFRLCALFTARPEFSPDTFTSGISLITLSRLASQQIESMLAELTEGVELPAEVISQIINRTDGVPLFVEEFMRMLLDSGALVEHEDRYELERPLADIEVPATLRDLLMSRLDSLGSAKQTAQVAAALGRELSLNLLSAVSTLEQADLLANLDALVTARLLQKKRKRGDQGYLFRHALTRDAAYDSLTKSARIAVHTSIVNAMEDSFPRLAENRPDLLAHHNAAADRKKEAVIYAQRAATGALQRSANAEAARQTRLALGWIDDIAPSTVRSEMEVGLQGSLTTALMALQGYASPDISVALKRSEGLMDELGDSIRYFPTLWSLSQYHHSASNRKKARTLAEKLVALAERDGSSFHRAIAYVQLGGCLSVDGQQLQAKEATAAALRHYIPDEHVRFVHAYAVDAKAWAAGGLGPILWFTGQPDQAIEHTDIALSWSRELNHANSVALSIYYTAFVHQLNHDHAKTLTSANELISFAQRRGLSLHENFGKLFAGWATQNVDNIRGALANLEGAGQRLGRTLYRAILSDTYVELGRYEEALIEIRKTLQLGEKLGERFYVPVLHRLEGLCLLQSGAYNAAERSLLRAIEESKEQQALMFELEATAALAELLKRRGQKMKALERLSPIYERFSEGLATAPLSNAKKLILELKGPDHNNKPRQQ